MSEEWVETTLGDLVSISTGKIDVNKAVIGGKYPFFTCANETYAIDDAPFEGKAILVTGNGDLNVKYYEGKFNAYQRTYFMFALQENVVLPKYIYYFMQNYIHTLRTQSIGSTIKYIKMGNLSEAKIYLPPIPVQRRIVDLMAHLDNHIEAVTEHLVALDNFKTSLLQRAFRPDGCGQVMRLGDLFTLEYGRALRKEVRASGSIQVFGSAGPTGFHDVPNFLSAGIVVGRKGVDSRSSFMTPIRSDLDVVRLGYSGWGGAGAVRWAPGSHWVIDTAYEVKPVSDSIGLRFLFWLLVHANLPKVATKTTLPGLSREAVYSIKVAVADAIDLHIEAIEELDRTQIANISEAHTLTVLRSSLLQGLLIGEISINSVYDRLLCEVA